MKYFLICLLAFCGCTAVHEVPSAESSIDSLYINDKAYIIKTNDMSYLIIKDTLNKKELKDVKYYIYIDYVDAIFGSPNKYSYEYQCQLELLKTHLDKEKDMRAFYRENPTVLRNEKQREYWDNYTEVEN